VRWHPCRPLLWGTVALAAVAPVAVGCSADRAATRPSVSPPAAPGPSAAWPSAGPGLSRGGVTTRIDAPAQSTEEEYFQACHAAKTWMLDRPGDRETLVEAYLAAVQAPQATGAGTWNVPWARLSPARQAAVIVAAHAAANDECG
jgi:Putative lipoprotein LpqV